MAKTSLSQPLEKVIADKKNKENELKKLVENIPSLEILYKDLGFLKSLNKEFKKRITTANSVRILTAVTLLEIANSLKSIDSKLDKSECNCKNKKEEDDKEEENDKKDSKKKLKNR